MDGSVNPTDLFRSPTRMFDNQNDAELPPLVMDLVAAEDADENKLYTYSHTTLYFKRSQILRLMLAWIDKHEGDPNNAHTDAALGDEIIPPTYYRHKPGSYWRIFKSNREFADDCYAPWCKTVDGVQTRPRSNNTPLKFETGEVFVREKRAEHHTQPLFRKQTMTISHMPEAEHVIFMMYVFCVFLMILPPVSKPRMSKAIRAIIADACDGRDFTNVLRKIPEDVLGKIKIKQIRNIALQTDTYVKSRSGPAPTTDPLELITMNSSIAGFQGEINDVYIDPKKLKPGQPKTKKVVEISYLNEDAWRVFLKVCPNAEKLKSHHKECKRIAMLPSLQEQTSECNNMLTSLTASQLIRGVSGVIQIDTTFGLSGLFVTLIVGVLPHFVSTRSKKNRPLILGFLMHSDRKVHHHTNMGRRIKDMISHIDPNKRISAYITDGESSLKEMCTGPAFSHAIHLRCDVHRRKNMLFKLQRVLSPEHLTLFEELMFGSKWENNLRETVHIGGAFALMDWPRFQKELTSIKDHFGEPKISDMLDRKAEDYYLTNSMMAKLRGGILCQWVTTNIIESMNFIIQRQIPRREAGNVTAGKIIHFIKNAVNDLWKATIDDSSEVSVAPTFIHGATTFVHWYKMKRNGKMELIETFGLPEKMAGKDSNLPQWVHENYDNIEKYLDKYIVEIVGDGNIYLVYKKEDPLCSLTVIARNDYLICGDNKCHVIYRHTKITPCRHIIKVLSSIHSNLSRKFWDKYQLNFEQLTPRQRLALTQEGGDGTKRIGNPRSKHNDVRKLELVTHRAYNNPAVESHTVDDSLDDTVSSSILPNRTAPKKPAANQSSSIFDDSAENEGAVERMGLTRVIAPTRAVTTIKLKKQTPVESHIVDNSLFDDSAENEGAVERMGLTRAIAPTRAVTTIKPKKQTPVESHIVDDSLFDDSAENEGAVERMGLTRAIAPTRAVTTIKPKKQTPVESHIVDDSLFDDSAENEGAVERMGLTRAIAPTRAVTTIKPKKQTPVESHTVDDSLFDDSAENEGAVERMGLTRAIGGGSTRPVKKTTTAPTRVVTTIKPKKPTPVESHTVAPTRAVTARTTKPSHLVKTKQTAARSRTMKNKPKHLGWSDDDMDDMEPTHVEESGLIEKDRDSFTQYSPTPYYDHATNNETAYSNETGIEESYVVEKPFAYGNIGGSMFPEFAVAEDFAVAEERMQQLEIARRPNANVEKERKRSPTPLLWNEKPQYEQLEVKPAKLPRLEAPLQINNINASYEATDGPLWNEHPNYEPLEIKPVKLLPRLEALRKNTTRSCYEERDVKPTTLSRRVLPAHDIVNFYSKNNDTDGLESKSIAVDSGEQLPHKATTARRSMRLASSVAVKEMDVEEKPSGIMEEPLESDAPKKKAKGRPRKIGLQRQ